MLARMLATEIPLLQQRAISHLLLDWIRGTYLRRPRISQFLCGNHCLRKANVVVVVHRKPMWNREGRFWDVKRAARSALFYSVLVGVVEAAKFRVRLVDAENLVDNTVCIFLVIIRVNGLRGTTGAAALTDTPDAVIRGLAVEFGTLTPRAPPPTTYGSGCRS